MIKKTFILVAVFALCSTALANRQLDRVEILDIFTTLTQTPTKTWLSVGTIEATHEEYRAPQTTDANEIDTRIAQKVQAYQDNPNKIQLTDKLQAMKFEAIPFNARYKLSNEYTMNSTVVVKYDGDKFYWQTNVDSRTDSVKKTVDMVGNFLTDEFDLNGNEERIFAWDGQKYTTYFKPVNHAIVTKEPGGVNGPLTAGVIPWGCSNYTYKKLSSADNLIGTENQVDGRAQIQLIVMRGDVQETFILDPAKNYALLQYSVYLPDNTSILQVYGGYQLVTNNWVPTNILIEKYDRSQNPQKLMVRDIWDITSVSGQTPPSAAFEVSYEVDAYVEDFCFGPEPLQYRYSSPQPPSLTQVNTDELLAQRLMIASAGNKQNCATASLKYVCDKLEAKFSMETLSQIVHSEKKSTTLAQMQQFAKNMKLEATAVKIDLKTLSALQAFSVTPERAHHPPFSLPKATTSENLPTIHRSVRFGLARNDNLIADGSIRKNTPDYQVIVHLPQQNHFVVLGDMDSQYVRLIDLSSNRFYYRQSIERFNSDWNGTALLVAKEPITLQGNFAKINSTKLNKIIGASDCEQCNLPCSSSGNFPCQEIGGSCGGNHITYFERSCCGSATSGSCSSSSLIYKSEAPCGLDPNTLDCTDNGEWESSTMSACG